MQLARESEEKARLKLLSEKKTPIEETPKIEETKKDQTLGFSQENKILFE